MPDDLSGQFIKFLRGSGYSVTRQRKKIAELVFSTPGCLSVEEIQSLLRQEKVPASAASVYRTLDILLKSNLVREHCYGKRFKMYETVRRDQHRDHLICTSCRRVMKFKNNIIEDLQLQVAGNHGFVITNHKLDIYGHCNKCRLKDLPADSFGISSETDTAGRHSVEEGVRAPVEIGDNGKETDKAFFFLAFFLTICVSMFQNVMLNF